MRFLFTLSSSKNEKIMILCLAFEVTLLHGWCAAWTAAGAPQKWLFEATQLGNVSKVGLSIRATSITNNAKLLQYGHAANVSAGVHSI